ncbi:MAG: long-chain fatty acid--CoA ligase [Oscillochloris sp.]|nr:long-chain fatty acid--CoA ligase [Oscillochloris sp.]
MERPWLAQYDAGVAPSLEYPRVPLYHLLDDSADRAPDRPCTLFFGQTLSYRRVRALSDRLAAGLLAEGIHPGDRVALLLPNSPLFVIAYYAILKAGAVVMPLNPLANRHELATQLQDAAASLLITIPRFAEVAAELHQTLPNLRLAIGNLATWMTLPLRLLMSFRESRERRALPNGSYLRVERLLATPLPAHFQPYPATPGCMAVLLYSGGTTGEAKGIMLSHAACVANAHQLRAWGDLGAEDRILAVLPLFHGYGMSVNMNAVMLAGGSIVLLPRFNVGDVLRSIALYLPTFFTGVPTMFAALADAPDLERYDLRSLKGIFVGAAPLTPQIKQAFEARSGARMIEGYGLTEAVTAIMANPYRGTHKIGSIGIPFPDVEVRIMGLDGKPDPTPGELGEIVLRSPTLMLGYYNRPDLTREAIVDGWLRSGDIGYLDEDGYCYITDRKKDLIIVGGFNVFPREVEQVLLRHPRVRDGVVIGIPDAYAGERVKAYVVREPGATLTEAELLAFLHKRLTSYKVPALIEFRTELPRTMIGKVLRRALREEQPQPASEPDMLAVGAGIERTG